MAYICARVNRKIFLPPRLEGGRAGEGGTGWRAKEKRGGGAGGDWVGDGRGLGRRDEGAQAGLGVGGGLKGRWWWQKLRVCMHFRARLKDDPEVDHRQIFGGGGHSVCRLLFLQIVIRRQKDVKRT